MADKVATKSSVTMCPRRARLTIPWISKYKFRKFCFDLFAFVLRNYNPELATVLRYTLAEFHCRKLSNLIYEETKH